MKTTSLLEHIGNTPLLHPQNFLTAMDCSATILAKYEGFNPGAVSYTHLDVYKRQDGARPIFLAISPTV